MSAAHKPELGAGPPRVPGIYACRQWYGWRVLEWDGRKWVYQGGMASWPEGAEAFEAWCGPLPWGGYPQHAPAPKPLPIKAPMEYDL